MPDSDLQHRLDALVAEASARPGSATVAIRRCRRRRFGGAAAAVVALVAAVSLAGPAITPGGDAAPPASDPTPGGVELTPAPLTWNVLTLAAESWTSPWDRAAVGFLARQPRGVIEERCEGDSAADLQLPKAEEAGGVVMRKAPPGVPGRFGGIAVLIASQYDSAETAARWSDLFSEIQDCGYAAGTETIDLNGAEVVFTTVRLPDQLHMTRYYWQVLAGDRTGWLVMTVGNNFGHPDAVVRHEVAVAVGEAVLSDRTLEQGGSVFGP